MARKPKRNYRSPQDLQTMMAERVEQLDKATDWDNLTPARHTAAVTALAAGVQAIAATHRMQQ